MCAARPGQGTCRSGGKFLLQVGVRICMLFEISSPVWPRHGRSLWSLTCWPALCVASVASCCVGSSPHARALKCLSERRHGRESGNGAGGATRHTRDMIL